MKTQQILLYENRRDVTLTTYILDNSPELTNIIKRPIVLICPGGGYLACSDREAEPVALRFAAMGYHAAVLRYSVYFAGAYMLIDPSYPIERREHSIFPNPLLDIARAFRLIHEQAGEWGVESDRIILCGFSAGAHNSAMYSVYWNSELVINSIQANGLLLKPAATILGYTISDYFIQKNQPKSEEDENFFAMSNLAYTGTRMPEDELFEIISPARHVNSDTPPMFLWATSEDVLVPVSHTIAMAAALAAQKIPFELHVFEEGQHGLSLATQATAAELNQINEKASTWLLLAEKWLQNQFPLRL